MTTELKEYSFIVNQKSLFKPGILQNLKIGF
jgi:hypothetical protein